MITNSKFAVDEASLKYQARTRLAELAGEIASTRSLNRSSDKVLQATKIRLWLKALDLKSYLTREQRERIWYALIQLSGIYDFPIAPVLANAPRPSILVVGGLNGTASWGSIGGTLSNQTDLQAALDGKVPYTGATGNVTLGEYGLTSGYVQFDTTPTTYTPAVGNMGWNDSEGTIDLLLKGGVVSLPLGQKQVARIVNGTGGNVLKSNYQVVKVTGAQGQRLQVNLAQANNDANSADTLGLIAENINNNNSGFIVTSGLLENINTTGSLQGETWADGNILYLSPTTAGAITNVKPQAPQHTVIVGFVVYAHQNNGKIYVKVDNGYELDELHNVKINTGTLSNGQVLKYNSSLQVWENNADAGITGTGTADYVPKFTGSTTLGNSIIRVSGTDAAYFSTLGTSNRNLFIGPQGVSGVSYTTAVGFESLANITSTATQNTAVGYQALNTVSTGRENVAVGVQAGALHDASYNTSIGYGSMSGNKFAGGNTAVGYLSMYNGDSSGTAAENTAIGRSSLSASNLTGSTNIAVGAFAGRNNTSGSQNIYVGSQPQAFPIVYNTTGSNNIFVGYDVRPVSITESNRTYIGNSSTTSTWLGGNLLVGTTTDTGFKADINGTLRSGTITVNSNGQSRIISTYYGANSDGYNIFIGGGGQSSVGQLGQTFKGSYNTSLGVNSLNANTTGFNNSAFGTNSLNANTTGFQNSAFGTESLESNINGYWNSAVGARSLYSNTSGTSNSAFGTYSLYSNTTGYANSAVGFAALSENISGNRNSAFGSESLYYNDSGSNNIAVGDGALFENTTGNNNTAIGTQAGYGGSGYSGISNTTGSNNIFIGYQSVGVLDYESNRTWIGNSSTTSTWLAGNLLVGTTINAGFKADINGTARIQGSTTITGSTTASSGLARGANIISTLVASANNDVLVGLTIGPTYSIGAFTGVTTYDLRTQNDIQVNQLRIGTGSGNISSNVVLGNSALNSNITGINNIAIGSSSLYLNTSNYNIAIGNSALYSNTSGSFNTAIGQSSLSNNTTSSGNTAVGYESLVNLTTGGANTAIGVGAGKYIADGFTPVNQSNSSIFLGHSSRANADNESNQIVIGYQTNGLGSNTTVIGNSSTTFGRWWGNLLLGTSTNVGSSIFTMDSTTKGFLRPRMTTTQRDAISTPATGLSIYNTTTNKVNYYNGTAWVESQDTITNPVTGTGTSGQVAYWNGTTTQTGSANLFWDNANTRLGIGTSLPLRSLHIAGSQIIVSSEAYGLTITRGGTLGLASQIYNSTATLYYGVDNSAGGFLFTNGLAFASYFGSGTNHALQLGTNSIIRQTIFNSGNIGINTTTDAGFRLDVNGTARVQGQITSGRVVTSLLTYGVGIGNNALSGTITGGGSTNVAVGDGAMSNSNSTNLVGNVAIGRNALRDATGVYNIAIGDQAMAAGPGFGQNIVIGDQSMTSGISGTSQFNNVTVIGRGVQTTNPNVAYCVALGSGSRITGSAQFVCGTGTDSNNTGAVTDIYFGSGIQRNAVDNRGGASYTINGSGAFGTDFAGGNITIAGGKGTGNATPGSVIFSTANTGASGTTLQSLAERMRIFGGTGNVLIQNGGTFTDAGFKLDVNGSIRAQTSSYGVAIETTNNGIIRAAGGFTSVDGTYAATSNLFLRAGFGGNVYITANNGNSTAFGLFLASSGINVGAGLSTVASAAFAINSTTQGFLPPRMTQAQRTAISSPAVGLMVYQTDGTEGVYVNTSSGWKSLTMV